MSKKILQAILLFIFPGLLLAQIKIMPLGNSITMGRHGEPAGYRDDLALMLLNAGINFDMVGSVNDGTGFYPHHEGHSGWRADEILDKLGGWLQKNPPDIVLLHIGTNDISQGQSNESTILDIENILNKIHNKNRDTIILLCSLIPRYDDRENRPQRTEDLNLLIYNLFLKKRAIGWDIHFVDQNSAFKQNPNWTTEWMDDYVHPNDAGYHVMAQTFFDVLSPLLTVNKYFIAGEIHYYSSLNPIAGANVLLNGTTNETQITNQAGAFQFDNLDSGGDFVITPTKDKISRYANSVITMYNAALVLRHSVGVSVLASNAQIAADVDKNGAINAYDAALIARYVVELEMLPNDHVGEWEFLPSSRSFTNLNSNMSNADFTGVLLGDVAGGWTSSGMAKNFDRENFVQYEIIQKDKNMSTLLLKLNADSVMSFLAEVKFNENDLKFSDLDNQTGVPFISNAEIGKIKLGFYSWEKVSFKDKTILINFENGRNLDANNMMFELSFQINQFQSEKRIAKLNDSAINYQSDILVKNNYPNPFNPSTTLQFAVQKEGILTVNIYNLLGQRVKMLYNDFITPGAHEIYWDGTDNSGMSVASGVYVCRFELNDFAKELKLIKNN